MNFLTFDEEYCVQQPFDPLGTVGKLAKYTILLHLYCVTKVYGQFCQADKPCVADSGLFCC